MSDPNLLFPFQAKTAGPRRVVLTGAGMISPLGQDWKTNAAGFRNGDVALRPVTLFDVSRQRARTAGEVDLAEEDAFLAVRGRRRLRLSRASGLLVRAAREAWNQSGWTADEPVPVILGTTSGSMSRGEEYYRQAIAQPHGHRGQPTRVHQYQVQNQVADLRQALGIRGPTTLIANACASGANAIGHAFEAIRFGQTDRVLTGGYDALSQLVFSGFDSLQALTTTQCRPFDVDRDGLTLGEGAAVFALETLDSARRRGALILGEICGYGAASDAHHITQPHPDGDAALLTMQTACAQAGIRPQDVGYVNAHGTGTPLNDRAESLALNRWAGDHAATLRVSSTKASIGHLLGAAGAVEVGVCLMALTEGWLPPMQTVTHPEPLANFQLVRQPESASFEYALTNSFGFGGANASVVLRRSSWS